MEFNLVAGVWGANAVQTGFLEPLTREQIAQRGVAAQQRIEASQSQLRDIDADVFLTTHVSFFGLDRKAYMDATALERYVTRISNMVERQYDEQSVAQVLDALHDAAAKADGSRYFGLFDRTAVYIGTDAGERWTLKEFRAFAEPHFSKGRGWTYVPTSRHVSIAPDRATAWFDEILENEKYGTTRGTGVLLKRDDEWKIVQYHLTIPVPNELAEEVVKMIRAK